MKQFLIGLFLLVSVAVQAQITAQPAPARIYFSNNQYIRTNATASLPPEVFPQGLVSFYPVGNLVAFQIDRAVDYYRPEQILNSSGVAYSTTVSGVINAILASVAAQSYPTVVQNAVVNKPDEVEAPTFAAAKLMVTPGVRKKFLILNNEIFNYPTESTYSAAGNWYHKPAVLQNN